MICTPKVGQTFGGAYFMAKKRKQTENVGLSNIYYTLSLKKEARYTLGDFQPGRIGVLLYSLMYRFNCLCRSSFAYKKPLYPAVYCCMDSALQMTTWENPLQRTKKERRLSRSFVELLTGFEPVTSSLPRKCSTC